MKIAFILSRLWRYLGLYFLKPNDAVNDTLTASLLYELDWNGSIVEIASGDGIFSYIMHGGIFPIWFDRYLITDLGKLDIYDTHQEEVLRPKKRLDTPLISLAIDAKDSHVKKVREIGFAKSCLVSPYENLPLASGSIEKIFYYIPHGLKDHELAMNEACRVLQKNGKLLILLYDYDVKYSFICYKLSCILPSWIAKYFKSLDNGRYAEITNIARSTDDWEKFFEDRGLKVRKTLRGLSLFAWKVYDIQTRPILKTLIKIFNFFPMPIRTITKFLWMVAFYPYTIVFYILFSNQFIRFGKRDCYVAFELEKF